MARIVDYQSLTQAISDFAHRADLADGLFTDYFIQAAQAKLANDVFTNNFGNGIEIMEVSFAPQAIQGGTLPVPSDWFSPKSFQVSDGSSDQFALIFKAATWIYDTYPTRQPEGLPAYIARDVMAPATFYGTISAVTATQATLTVLGAGGASPAAPVGLIQIGMPISDGGNQIVPPCTITAQLSGVTGGVGTYSIATSTLTGSGTEKITGGGNVFIFGPYPDSAYTVSGTYYSKGTALSVANTTNWMVLNCPETLHAYCMIEAGKFLKDQGMVAQWTETAQDFLLTLIERDKGERWAASTMQIETG